MSKTPASTVPSVPRSHWGSGSRLLPRAPGSPVWVRLREDFFRIEFACAPSLGWVALRAQLRTAWHSFLRCGHKSATLYGLKQHRSPLSFSLFPRSEPSRGLPGGKPRCPQGSGRQSVPLPFLCSWRVWGSKWKLTWQERGMGLAQHCTAPGRGAGALPLLPMAGNVFGGGPGLPQLHSTHRRDTGAGLPLCPPPLYASALPFTRSARAVSTRLPARPRFPAPLQLGEVM